MVAFLALLIALGGTSWAAVTITGQNVKNSSLTGKDVKDKSLTSKDFKGSVRGARGAAGATGATGPTGATGATGLQGVSGVTNVTRLEVVTGFEDGLMIDPLLVSEVGPFTKNQAGSRIKLIWNGTGQVDSAGAGFCDFQLRIDGLPPGGEGGRGIVFANGQAVAESAISTVAYFGGLTPGAHQVDIYVRSNPATTTRCTVAPGGGFEDEIFVEELPS